MTVNPAGAEARDGVIGSGRINGQRWRVVVQPPGTGGAGQGNQCILATGAGLNGAECVPVPSADIGDPVSLTLIGAGRAQAQYGAVSAAVTRVTVTLADGTVLVLHPTAAYGQRYVAFAIPLPMAISRVVAYSARGEIGYAVPFSGPAGNVVTFWLQPGQRGLRRMSYRIGSGTVDGSSWSETVHAGPWGYCFTGPQADCLDTQARSFGNRVGIISAGGPSTTGYDVGTASAAVSRVRVTLSGGKSVTVRVVNAGGPGFYAFAVPKEARLVRVTYLAASGRQVASQSGSQIY